MTRVFGQRGRNWRERIKFWPRDASLRSWATRVADRQVFVSLGFLILFLIVAVRVVEIGLTNPDSLQIHRDVPKQEFSRADIVDRNGEELAMTVSGYALYAHPHEMNGDEARRRVAIQLAALIDDIDPDRLAAALTSGRKFIWIKQRLTPEQKQDVHDLGEPGLHFGRRPVRVYPKGKLAAHILGGTTYGDAAVNSAVIVGNAGVEHHMDARLTAPGQSHQPLELSIDSRVQNAVAKYLARGKEEYQANRASAVLMDVQTGEIHALVSLPDFDPNARADHQSSELFCDPVQGVFEFGSTFKIFAAVQAIELGHVTPDSMISNQSFRLGRYKIRSTERGDKMLTLRDVIAQSSNAGVAQLALNIGSAKQRDFLSQLGLLEKSGIEFTEAQNVGPLTPSRWTELETATISYGHGVAVTQVQLAAAYATLVNGGFRVTPTILKRTDMGPATDRVISEETSRAAVELLRAVVTDGTARGANIPEVAIGGKTGTADKQRPEGGYYQEKVLATFASVFPTDNPRYALVVTLDEGTSGDGSKWERSAGRTAVPVATVIIEKVAPLLGLDPNEQRIAARN